MDVIHNFGEASEEDDCGKKAVTEESGAIFELTDETGELNYPKANDENHPQIGNFLQKLHIDNHDMASKETIHEFSRSGMQIVENESELLSEEDEYLFNNVRQAMAEKDILDLRSNLRSISQSIFPHQWNSEEIESCLHIDLDTGNRGMMLDESQSDRIPAEVVDFYNEIDEAIGEKDIMQLHSELKSILNVESAHFRSTDEIEDYLNDELEVSAKNSFDNELMNNCVLADEVKLYGEISEALGERDVIELRATLEKISRISLEPGNQKKRGIFPLKLKRAIFYASAASVILLLGLNVIFRPHSYTSSELYLEYYQPVKSEMATTRSAERSEEGLLNQAMTKMSIKEYDTALKLFSDLLVQDQQNSFANFYIGAVYQAKGEYDDAITSFTKVIAQGDNLFIEQAEWYRGLCYLTMDQRENAISQFGKISIGDGYYRQQSIALLKKLEQK